MASLSTQMRPGSSTWALLPNDTRKNAREFLNCVNGLGGAAASPNLHGFQDLQNNLKGK